MGRWVLNLPPRSRGGEAVRVRLTPLCWILGVPLQRWGKARQVRCVVQARAQALVLE